jgi:predicted ATP-grasp superfamily ATP-dependent carboligase
MESDVIITDGNYKNALAAIRALGKSGVFSTVCSDSIAIAFFSKYCRTRYIYTSPKYPNSFLRDIYDLVKKRKKNVLMPIGAETTVLISSVKKRLSQFVKVSAPDYTILEKAHDKFSCINIAKTVGVPVPQTILFTKGTDLKKIISKVSFPVVIKANRGVGVFKGVRYAYSPRDLLYKCREVQNQPSYSNMVWDFQKLLIQEYIPGEIRDVVALFNNGVPRAAVVQRRVITYPPEGGVGIMNETINDRNLLNLAIKILKRLRWHGVAQVEFKLDSDNIPRLMEVNPKFWGTLELAIASGVNFPYLLYTMVMEGDVKPTFSYRKNLQMWWVNAGFIRFIPSLKNTRARNRLLSEIFDLHKKKCIDFHFSDIGSSLVQFIMLNLKPMISDIYRKQHKILEYPRSPINLIDISCKSNNKPKVT